MEMPPARLLQEEIDRFMNMGFYYYAGMDKTRGEPGYRAQQRTAAEEQIHRAREVIASITDQPLPTEH